MILTSRTATNFRQSKTISQEAVDTTAAKYSNRTISSQSGHRRSNGPGFGEVDVRDLSAVNRAGQRVLTGRGHHPVTVAGQGADQSTVA